jgi:hypothetical protein
VRKFPLQIIALLIIVSYSAMAISPLATFAAKSKIIARAVTGVCAGDCGSCGCSPEHSANHTCCCWKKKLQDDHEHEHTHTADCCKKKDHGSKTVLSCGCPCGSNKLLAFWNGETYEQLPYRFSADTPVFRSDCLSTLYRKRLTSRHGEPPDPPPKPVIPC